MAVSRRLCEPSTNIVIGSKANETVSFSVFGVSWHKAVCSVNQWLLQTSLRCMWKLSYAAVKRLMHGENQNECCRLCDKHVYRKGILGKTCNSVNGAEVVLGGGWRECNELCSSREYSRGKNTTRHGERKQYGLLKNHRAVWEETDS